MSKAFQSIEVSKKGPQSMTRDIIEATMGTRIGA